MAKTVIEDYQIKHNGKIHSFKELCNAMIFCDKWGLLYPSRLFEKEPQPYIRQVFPFAYDVRANREKKEVWSIAHQIEHRKLKSLQ